MSDHLECAGCHCWSPGGDRPTAWTEESGVYYCYECSTKRERASGEARPDAVTEAERLLRSIMYYAEAWEDGDSALHAVGHIQHLLREHAPRSEAGSLKDERDDIIRVLTTDRDAWRIRARVAEDIETQLRAEAVRPGRMTYEEVCDRHDEQAELEAPSGSLDAIGILTRDRDEWKRRAQSEAAKPGCAECGESAEVRYCLPCGEKADRALDAKSEYYQAGYHDGSVVRDSHAYVAATSAVDAFWQKQCETREQLGYLRGRQEEAAERARELLAKPCTAEASSHSCDFEAALAWLREYAEQGEKGCSDTHALWKDAELTEVESGRLARLLASKPWQKRRERDYPPGESPKVKAAILAAEALPEPPNASLSDCPHGYAGDACTACAWEKDQAELAAFRAAGPNASPVCRHDDGVSTAVFVCLLCKVTRPPEAYPFRPAPFPCSDDLEDQMPAPTPSEAGYEMVPASLDEYAKHAERAGLSSGEAHLASQTDLILRYESAIARMVALTEGYQQLYAEACEVLEQQDDVPPDVLRHITRGESQLQDRVNKQWPGDSGALPKGSVTR